VYADEAKTIGRFLRKTRTERGLSLEVVAGLAGISVSHLSRVERGEAILDRMSHIQGVADALGIPLWKILRLPESMPGNRGTDSAATVGIRRALDAVILDKPGGEVLPVRELRKRVEIVLRNHRWCRFVQVSAALPRLIRDLHTTIDTGRDLDVLLPLAVLLHVHVTRMFLRHAGAPIDLRRLAVFLARDLARRHDTATSLGLAAYGVTDTLIKEGAFELAQAELDDISLPPVTADTVGLVCATMATRAWLIAIDGGDADAVLVTAAEIAEPFGELSERDQLDLAFGPACLGIRRIGAALALGDDDRAVHLARSMQPEAHPFPASEAFYWTETGRALARVRGRVDDAVIAYRKAEDLSPVQLYRDPVAREVISGLLTRARRNAMGEELQGLAGRLGI